MFRDPDDMPPDVPWHVANLAMYADILERDTTTIQTYGPHPMSGAVRVSVLGSDGRELSTFSMPSVMF